jgi:hypothetical protein
VLAQRRDEPELGEFGRPPPKTHLVSSSTRAHGCLRSGAMLLYHRVAQDQQIIQVVELLWLG